MSTRTMIRLGGGRPNSELLSLMSARLSQKVPCDGCRSTVSQALMQWCCRMNTWSRLLLSLDYFVMKDSSRDAYNSLPSRV